MRAHNDRVLSSTIIFIMAMTLCSGIVEAQPSMSRGQQLLAVGNGECLRRAAGAMAAEGFSAGGAGNFAQGFRGDSGAYIICNDAGAQQSVVNTVVASLSQDSGVPGAIRQALQARMAGTVVSGGGGGNNLALKRPARQSSTSEWSKPNDAQGGVDGPAGGRFGLSCVDGGADRRAPGNWQAWLQPEHVLPSLSATVVPP